MTIDYFVRAAEKPLETAREHAGGRPIFVLFPAYFPAELIWAAGGAPVSSFGSPVPITRADAHLQSFACSVARTILETEMSGASTTRPPWCSPPSATHSRTRPR
jgi:benzoyl-CoA reductase/2-hydroxyglutaryl-CoA dehydratase subunit BcrC/BadD/HgdB